MRNILKKIKNIDKFGNLIKITSTFTPLSNIGLTSTSKTLISIKFALTVVPKTAVVRAVLQLLRSQQLEVHLVCQEKNLSIFIVQELRELCQKSFEDNVTNQTESS